MYMKEFGTTNQNHLKKTAYSNKSQIEKRKALYEYTSPHFVIEDEIIDVLHLSGKKELLDVGCGQCLMPLKVGKTFPRASFHCVDISSGMFKEAQAQANKESLPIHFYEQDVQSLSFKNSTFDRVTAIHMMYHVPNIKLAISELHRILKPKGFLVLSVNSLKSKEMLRKLKIRVADYLNIDQYPDPTTRFNIENGTSFLEQFFPHVTLKKFKSDLTIYSPQPYVDYFDSTREFWDPYPEDKKWQNILEQARERIQLEIDRRGKFKEQNLFGIFIASK